ncbi:MAG: YhjD/YihY/BrkB family envelope integrity protein, partial [Planctomycetota bacterium]
MARLSDVPRVLKHVGPFAFVRRVAHQVGEDNLLTWAAAMAYSWLFALFPFLIFLLSLLPLLPDRVRIWIVDQVDTSIETQLPGPAGDTVSQTLRPMLGVSDKPPTFKDFLTGQDDDGDEFTVEGRMIAEGDETITFFSDAFGRRTFDRANVTVTTKEQRLEEWNRTVGSRQVQSWTGLFSFG